MRECHRCIMAILTVTLFAVSIYAQRNTETENQTANLQALTDELKEHAWAGIRLTGMSPANWTVHVTRPMKEILKHGSAAQSILLQRISDPRITDQVIFLLGGVGDERVIGPIISAMIDSRSLDLVSNATKINFSADFALTNITAAEWCGHILAET